MRRRAYSFPAAIAFFVFASIVARALAQTGGITIDLWSLPPLATNNAYLPTAYNQSRYTPPGAVDLYGALSNQGITSDAITGVTSPAGSSASLVMWVRGFQLATPLPLALPAHKDVTLGPQSQFLRLYGGRASWKPGDKFPLTLHFQHAPDVKVNIVVRAQ